MNLTINKKCKPVLFVYIILFLIFNPLNAKTKDNHSDNKNKKSSKKDIIYSKKGRISLFSRSNIKFSYVCIKEKEVIYIPVGLNEERRVNIKKVVDIELQKGSYALMWGGISALIGLAAAIEASAETDDWNGGLILGTTLVCGGLGLLFGSLHKKYVEVYPKSELRPEIALKSIPGIGQKFVFAMNLKVYF